MSPESLFDVPDTEVVSFGFPPIVNDLLVTQNVFHAATVYFDFEEDSSYYTERPIMVVVPEQKPDGRIRFNVHQNTISLIDGFEVNEIIENIDFKRFAQAADNIQSFFNEKLESYRNIPYSRVDIVEILKERFIRLGEIANQILSSENKASSQNQIEKDKLIFLWEVNDLFRNDEGKSIEYSRSCIHFFQSQL